MSALLSVYEVASVRIRRLIACSQPCQNLDNIVTECFIVIEGLSDCSSMFHHRTAFYCSEKSAKSLSDTVSTNVESFLSLIYIVQCFQVCWCCDSFYVFVAVLAQCVVVDWLMKILSILLDSLIITDLFV